LIVAHPRGAGAEIVRIRGLLRSTVVGSVGACGRVRPAGHAHSLVPDGLDVPVPQTGNPNRYTLLDAEPAPVRLGRGREQDEFQVEKEPPEGRGRSVVALVGGVGRVVIDVSVDDGTDDRCFQVAVVGPVPFAHEVAPSGPKPWGRVRVDGGDELEPRVPDMTKARSAGGRDEKFLTKGHIRWGGEGGKGTQGTTLAAEEVCQRGGIKDADGISGGLGGGRRGG